MAEKTATKDWVTPVALVGGAIMLGAGAYLVLKKPSVIRSGDKIKANFKFKYAGSGGVYVLQVSFGNKIFDTPVFDHVEGLTFTKEINLTEAKDYVIDLIMALPMGVTPNVYDAEALIAAPPLSRNILGQFDYLVKSVTEGALKVVA